MNIKELFKNSAFTSPSRLVEVFRFHHDASGHDYRVEIAESAEKTYVATVLEEVENEETGRATLELLSDFPWVDEPTPDIALEDAIDSLTEWLSNHKNVC